MKPLTDEELQSFYEYADENMVEPDGSQCQWADYSCRCVDEIRRLREEVEHLETDLKCAEGSNTLNCASLRILREENERLTEENKLLNSEHAKRAFNVFKNLWLHSEEELKRARELLEEIENSLALHSYFRPKIRVFLDGEDK